MTKKPIVIFGSSRNNGNTWKALQLVIKNHDVDVENLNDLNFSGFDYDFKNKDDDFMPLAEKMIKHDTIILATPIYWYSMSSLMKRFIERWTDFLYARKDIAEKLKGKTLYVIASHGSYPEGKHGFEPALQQTADYFGMTYGGALICYFGDNKEISDKNESLAKAFEKRVFDL